MRSLLLRNMTIRAPGATHVNTSTIWAAVVAFVALLAAGVALLTSGMDTAAAIGFLTGIVTVMGGVIAAYDRLTTIQRVNVVQDEKIDTVVEQTNGKLREVVAAELAAALDTRFGPAPSKDDGV